MKTTKKVEERPVALITGGAKRLGAAIGIYLAQYGFALAVHYNESAKEAKALCRNIAAKGGVAQPFQANLLKDDANILVEKITAEFGTIALLVNNASLFRRDSLPNLDNSLWEAHFKLHLQVPVLLSQAVMQTALPTAGQKNRSFTGLIINMIDQRVLHLNPHFFSYTLSKAALYTATQTMAQSFAPYFRVNAVAPGPSLKNKEQTDQDFANQCATLPMQAGPKSEDFGKTICYLWETPSITGQIIALDGGQHLMWQTPDLEWDIGKASGHK